MGESKEAPKPSQAEQGPKKFDRRNALRIIGAAVAGIWGLGNKDAYAQKKTSETPKPVVAPNNPFAAEKPIVDPKPLETLMTKDKFDQFGLNLKALTSTARILMPEANEIQVIHNWPSGETMINPDILSSYGSVNGYNIGLIEINTGKVDSHTLDYALLLAGEAVAKVINKGNGGKVVGAMEEFYKKMTNSALNADAAKFDEFLDISNYVEGAKLKPDEDRLDSLKLTYYRTYAILRLEPDKLLEKLKKSPDAEKVANIFLSALSVTSGLNPEVNISKLGFDESLIKKLVVIGGNKIKIPLAA